MKYCTYCGNPARDEAVVCVRCGCQMPRINPVANAAVSVRNDDTLPTIAKVFLILGCISQGWLILPLAWCIPITVSIWKKLERGESIGTGLKICTLIFVSLVSGVCLLCMDD